MKSSTIRSLFLLTAVLLLVWSAAVLAGWWDTGTPAVLDHFAAAYIVLAFTPWPNTDLR